ncbi:hypothetical protein OGAPHI_002025 [Ogataea philodendri]|uniref:Sugar phosphate transporter domain-containing protein n=1 Tax=Ogataea philodendri TaxID=1378263 RepID=A0A9P8T7S6_9ASCO|nr:uncharacterized protein OGAPHI_002025 [Ogataea philodendri]KAH3668271.1 hypothetical protein OGAPHI_002025 [Ogataea philodendri]
MPYISASMSKFAMKVVRADKMDSLGTLSNTVPFSIDRLETTPAPFWVETTSRAPFQKQLFCGSCNQKIACSGSEVDVMVKEEICEKLLRTIQTFWEEKPIFAHDAVPPMMCSAYVISFKNTPDDLHQTKTCRHAARFEPQFENCTLLGCFTGVSPVLFHSLYNMLFIFGQPSIQNVRSSVKELASKVAPLFPLIDWKLCLLCAIWYTVSVVSSNSTKSILRNFDYPVTLTEFQFMINALCCLLTVAFVKKYDAIFASHRHHLNPNSLYADKSSDCLLEKFPKGTFPTDLNHYNYRLTDFLKPTLFVLKTTLPMGMFQFVGHIASHKATSVIPVSLVHTIKALSPLTTVLIYRFMFNQQFGKKTYFTLLPLMVGVMLSCVKNNKITADSEFFYTGCVFAFISMLIFVSQNIFAKKILTFEAKEAKNDYFTNTLNYKVVKSESATSTPMLPIAMTPKHASPPVTPLLGNSSQSLNKLVINSEKKLDKMSVLFHCSVVGFLLTLPPYILTEISSVTGFSLFEIDQYVAGLIFVNGMTHFVQSVVAFQILGMVSPINYSIANILKRIIIISCSILVEGTHLSAVQWTGLALTFIGLYCYDKWGVQRKN